MTDNLKIFKTEHQLQIKDAQKMLEEISKLEYETILVVAIKDGQWEVFQSSYMSIFKLLGIMDVIKQKILDFNLR